MQRLAYTKITKLPGNWSPRVCKLWERKAKSRAQKTLSLAVFKGRPEQIIFGKQIWATLEIQATNRSKNQAKQKP